MQALEGLIRETSCAAIEQAGNRLLSLDPEAQSKLESFADKVIHIRIEDFQLDYYFLFPGGSLVVLPKSDREPSASIQGKMSAFIGSINAENSGDSIFKGDLHFSGEINVARQFQSLTQSLKIDWQEPISQVFGDVVGHNISQGIKHIGGFLEGFIGNLKQDVPEYLREEIQVTPSKLELDNFYESIDTLRSQTDRLEARIQRLKTDD
ncbi:hypothetical protein FLL45_06760 [Aliikangiella marina]|uniref:Ubiquinone biosynthesis accessory factor UbiJ n=1 Tax=Aliikangiella marina TaxID=1712262 RepID=A0A545TBS3_9GAMM|nr:SCP2 sterol-binding domain-containing protein [Aliikangiella marina]TQV74657.1 hypothetical protein FLL45_06760 [Aliikangiella marina]